MSNYGPSFPSGDQPNGGQPGAPQQPYGNQPGTPYGNQYGQPGSPYGSSYPGAPQQPTSTDGVSITGFVLSLTCCLSFVGAILGFVGLGRTKDDQRKGRWAAISAIVLGIVGTLVTAGVAAFVFWFASNTITPGDAEVGQCADISEVDRNTIALQEKDCSDDHDAEVTYTGEYGEIEEAANSLNIDDLAGITTDATAAFTICTTLMDSGDVATLSSEDLKFGIATEGRDDDDAFLCYVESSDGEALSGSFLG